MPNAQDPAEIAGVSPEFVAAFALDRLQFGRPDVATASLLRLDGKVALVTGGGGDGLGYSTCQRLAEQGAEIVVLDVSADAAHATAESVTRRWGVRCLPVAADVGSWEQIQHAVAEATREMGRIDVLVNNAGGGLDSGRPFLEVPVESISAVVSLNFIGVLNATRAVLGAMRARGSGRILNVSSEVGRVGMENIAVYGSCKAATIAFTRHLAHELRGTGVTIAGVSPGLLIAERNLRAFRDAADERLVAIRDGMSRSTIGRCALPDEVASVIAFLASPAAAYVHGTTVSVGGGMAD